MRSFFLNTYCTVLSTVVQYYVHLHDCWRTYLQQQGGDVEVLTRKLENDNPKIIKIDAKGKLLNNM